MINKDKKLKELKKLNEEADEELKDLEKIYLEKMSKLLLMAHLHSETISVINICNKYETNDEEEEEI